MRLVKNSINFIVAHIVLFLGFILMHPVIVSALNDHSMPWDALPYYFWPGIFMIVISGFLIYRNNERFSSTLQSLGVMIFLPGTLSLFLNFFSVEGFFSSMTFTGATTLQYIADKYSAHSIDIGIGISAFYLLFGGIFYYIGHKVENIRDKMHPLR